jgi:hypothetical protein
MAQLPYIEPEQANPVTKVPAAARHLEHFTHLAAPQGRPLEGR